MLGDRRATPAHENAGVKNPPHSPSRKARRQGGFTLIEVMVALVVLVLGVLGAAAMTITAIRDSKQSALRSQATSLAYELSDLLRMSPNQEAVFTSGAPTAVPGCWTTGCSVTDIAKNNFYEWDQKVKGSGLPNGDYKICRDSANLALTQDAAGVTAFGTCDGAATSPLVVKFKWDEKLNNARGQYAVASPVIPAFLVVPIQPY